MTGFLAATMLTLAGFYAEAIPMQIKFMDNVSDNGRASFMRMASWPKLSNQQSARTASPTDDRSTTRKRMFWSAAAIQ